LTAAKRLSYSSPALNWFNRRIIGDTKCGTALKFSTLKRAMFVNPNTSPTSTAFGTVSGQKAHARRIQMALKILF
jgi:hypothetical protein